MAATVVGGAVEGVVVVAVWRVATPPDGPTVGVVVGTTTTVGEGVGVEAEGERQGELAGGAPPARPGRRPRPPRPV